MLETSPSFRLKATCLNVSGMPVRARLKRGSSPPRAAVRALLLTSLATFSNGSPASIRRLAASSLAGLVAWMCRTRTLAPYSASNTLRTVSSGISFTSRSAILRRYALVFSTSSNSGRVTRCCVSNCSSNCSWSTLSCWRSLSAAAWSPRATAWSTCCWILASRSPNACPSVRCRSCRTSSSVSVMPCRLACCAASSSCTTFSSADRPWPSISGARNCSREIVSPGSTATGSSPPARSISGLVPGVSGAAVGVEAAGRPTGARGPAAQPARQQEIDARTVAGTTTPRVTVFTTTTPGRGQNAEPASIQACGGGVKKPHPPRRRTKIVGPDASLPTRVPAGGGGPTPSHARPFR